MAAAEGLGVGAVPCMPGALQAFIMYNESSRQSLKSIFGVKYTKMGVG